MFKLPTFAVVALAIGAAAIAPTAAEAQRHHGNRYERGHHARQNHDYRAGPRHGRRYERRQHRRCEPRAGRGVIGAIAGGLLGNTAPGRGAALANNPRRCR